MANVLERRKISPDKIPEAVAAKWSAEALDEGFTPIPKRLLRCLSKLFPSPRVKQLQVILAVADYLRPNLARGPSLEYLAFIAGLPEEEFRQILKELTAKGWVRAEGPDEALTVSIGGFIRRMIKETEEDEESGEE